MAGESTPIRFELSQHRDIGYRVSVPNLLPNHDDRLPVREDRVTESDVETVAAAMWERERHQWTGAPIWPHLAEEQFWSGCPDAMRARASQILEGIFLDGSRA